MRKEKRTFGIFEILRKEEKKRTREKERKGEGEIARIQAKINTTLTKERKSCIPKSSHYQKTPLRAKLGAH